MASYDTVNAFQRARGEQTRQRILVFLRAFVDERGYAPSMREIGCGVGIKSTNTISYHLKELAASGLIQRQPNISRGIVVLDWGLD